MADLALVADEVSKRYRLGVSAGGQSLREAITDRARRGLRPGPARSGELWALRDVSFELAEGQTLGVIGRNGSGKSTLLKILTRITEPTLGRTRTRGRVGAILEVGTGFNGELTGRENVYLSGAILGMKRRDVNARFDDIAAFAGVERFMETPVKRYSSGMYLRLAFSVAAHLEPDIFVVDEVLAVGDAEFQRRCLDKVSAFATEGRTVLFVSHDLSAVSRLCRRALWLEGGTPRRLGPVEEVIDAYTHTILDHAAEADLPADVGQPVLIEGLRLLAGDGRPALALSHEAPMTVEATLLVREPVPDLELAVFVHDAFDAGLVAETWSKAHPPRADRAGRYTIRAELPAIFSPGDHVVGVSLWSDTSATPTMAGRLRVTVEGPEADVPSKLRVPVRWTIDREDADGPAGAVG